jgi:AsmA-like C-terminal region
VAPIKALAYGGALDGAMVIDASAKPRIAFKGKLSDLNLRAVHVDLSRPPWRDGRADLTWDLNAAGGSVGTLRADLTGPVTLAVHGGKMAGVDMRAALLAGRAELGKPPATRLQEFNAEALTPFNDFKAGIEFRDGRARGQNIEFSSGPIHAVGSGEILLESGQVDLRLNASVGKASQDLGALTGVNVPIQVSGPWDTPRYTFDYGAATGGVATRPVEPVSEPVVAHKGSAPEPVVAKPAVATAAAAATVAATTAPAAAKTISVVSAVSVPAASRTVAPTPPRPEANRSAAPAAAAPRAPTVSAVSAPTTPNAQRKSEAPTVAPRAQAATATAASTATSGSQRKAAPSAVAARAAPAAAQTATPGTSSSQRKPVAASTANPTTGTATAAVQRSPAR